VKHVLRKFQNKLINMSTLTSFELLRHAVLRCPTLQSQVPAFLLRQIQDALFSTKDLADGDEVTLDRLCSWLKGAGKQELLKSSSAKGALKALNSFLGIRPQKIEISLHPAIRLVLFKPSCGRTRKSLESSGGSRLVQSENGVSVSNISMSGSVIDPDTSHVNPLGFAIVPIPVTDVGNFIGRGSRNLHYLESLLIEMTEYANKLGISSKLSKRGLHCNICVIDEAFEAGVGLKHDDDQEATVVAVVWCSDVASAANFLSEAKASAYLSRALHARVSLAVFKSKEPLRTGDGSDFEDSESSDRKRKRL
jgi:hypothetical protein